MWSMATPSALTRKSHNRIKSLCGSVGVGEKIELGKPHAKGYRITCGRTTAGTQARFWLGHREDEAQQRAQAIIAMWVDMTSAGYTQWTPELIAKAKSLGEQKVGTLRHVAAAL